MRNLGKIIVALTFALLIIWIHTESKGDLSKRPNRPGLIYWHGNVDKSEVALTFDDGPNEPYTSEILNILKRENVTATFFMVGENVAYFPEVARRVADEGHAIGNHSLSHPDMRLDTKAKVKREIEDTEELIQKITGKRTFLFRPPYGADAPWVFHETEKMGYVIVKWSLSAHDWRRKRRTHPQRAAEYIISKVENGDIILLHDGNKLLHGGDRSSMVKMLPILISGLKARGFKMVTVPQLLGLEEAGP